MHTCIVKGKVYVAKRGLSGPQIRALRRFYTEDNPKYLMAKKYSPYGTPKRIPEFLYLYQENATHLLLPRGNAGAALHTAKVAYQFTHNTAAGDKTLKLGKPKVKFTTEQQQVLGLYQRLLHLPLQADTRCFLLKASTSVGKTLLLLEFARLAKRPTLILCNTLQVLLAWQADMEKFYGLTPRKVGLIKGATHRVAAVTIASVRTLAKRREYWPALNKKFGTMILDEAQDMSAPSVHEFVLQSPARWRIAASATTTRRDQRVPELDAGFGLPRINVTVYEDTGTVMQLSQCRTVVTAFDFPTSYGALQWDEMLEYMAADNDRLQQVVDWLVRDYEAGRVILATARTRDYIAVVRDELIYRGIADVNLLTGDYSRPSYVRALLRSINGGHSRIILGTDATVGVGANIRRIDSLHICTPHASKDGLRQLFGRIRRRHPDKPPPMVTYYHDRNNGYLNQLYHRYWLPVMHEHMDSKIDEVNKKAIPELFGQIGQGVR